MKIFKHTLAVLLSVILLAGTFFAGYYLTRHSSDDLITEKRTVTKDEIKTELFAIEQISTYEGEYNVTKTVDESRYILEFAIPGTKNTIEFNCKGIVKVGYDFNNITINVDNVSKKIYIKLPNAKVNDNYVIVESVEWVEKNSIFNPIDFSQYKELITDIESEGLKDAESKGLYVLAQENMHKLIDLTLSKFESYEIVYM